MAAMAAAGGAGGGALSVSASPVANIAITSTSVIIEQQPETKQKAAITTRSQRAAGVGERASTRPEGCWAT